MGLGHGTNIVRNGLVLHLDAVNPKSYPGSGTTWFDLSGNGNNGALVNGTSFDSTNKCFNFDGVDDYVQFTSVAVNTIFFCGRMDPTIPVLAGLVCSSATGDGSLRTQGGTFRSSGTNAPNAADFQYNYVSQFMINGESNLSSDASGFYVVPNGRTLNQDFCLATVGNTLPSVSTISHTFLSRVYKGRVYAVCLYNRFLSDDEMKQNFEALRGRYGI